MLKGNEATIELQPTAQPRFCKNQPVPFAKVETLLKAQVDQVELRPVDKAEWATPNVLLPKMMVVFVFAVILRSQASESTHSSLTSIPSSNVRRDV